MHLSLAKPSGPRWTIWALGFGVWTFLGLTQAVHSYFSYASQGKAIPWAQALALGLSLWYGWAVLWLGVYQLARRFPLGHLNWPRGLALHLAASIVFALVKIGIDYPIIKLFYCPTPHLLTFPRFYRMGLTSQFHLYVLIYWALVGVAHALNLHRKNQERELRASHLETWLARTQLQLLQKQLHPHFLFNTLSTISVLIHQDIEVADRMVARLGELLRLTLENFGVEEVPVCRELDFIGAYLEIEQVRFGPRLRVQVEIEESIKEASVPSLLLQPLVENALRHGIGPRGGAGHLTIRGWQAGERLRLQVEDNGAGLPAQFRERVGLTNTRARLRQLYGEQHTFRLQNVPAGGVRVTVELPFRVADEDAMILGAPPEMPAPRLEGVP